MNHNFRLFKELMGKLSYKELSQLKKKFETKIESSDRNKIKSKKLLSFFLKNPEIQQIELEKKLYGITNKEAFDKLIERAIEKIDEVIIDFSRDSISVYSERNYYFFYLKRKLLIIQMRLLRGIDFDIDNQLEKIISIAKKYELYDAMIDALLAKQRSLVLRNKSKATQVQNLILKYEEIRRKVQDARNIWTKLSVQMVHFASYANYQEELILSIKTLKDYYRQTESFTIGFYYLFLVVALKQGEEDYKAAEFYLNKMLALVMNNKSVYTNLKHIDILVNIANNKILVKNFSSAISFILRAKQLFKSTDLNNSVVSEIEFIARFFNKEYDVAEQAIKEICNVCRSNGEAYMLSRFAFYYACLKTNQGEISKSNELLLEVKEIDKDKGGWNLGKRILTIINGIESEDYEGVELKVLSLEKFIKRISKTSYVRKRDKIISRIFLKLINENFDFNKVYTKRKEYFDLLEGNDPEYAWKIKSPELIVFHEWFKKKIQENSKMGVANLSSSN
jgi:hypothetical protein